MLLSWLGAVFIGALAPFFLVMAFVANNKTVLAVFIPLAVLQALLACYVARDALGKRPWKVKIGPSGLSVDLPAGRSLIHNPPGCKRTIAGADVAQVQARTEVYKGLFFAQAHRAYRLLLQDGSDIFLFEERALATSIASAPLNPVAADIAAHLGTTFSDLGVAQGHGGLLGAIFARAPDWGAPALAPDAQRRIWARVQLTGVLMMAAVALVVILLVIF